MPQALLQADLSEERWFCWRLRAAAAPRLLAERNGLP